jgi:nucleoside-diphosphate-sugar epimerase
MDNSKLNALGWNAKVDFNEGLKRTIEWYKKEKGML